MVFVIRFYLTGCRVHAFGVLGWEAAREPEFSQPMRPFMGLFWPRGLKCRIITLSEFKYKASFEMQEGTTMETITIEIDQATATILQAKAATRGLSLETLLRHLAANGAAAKGETTPPTSLEEFMADMESLAEGTEHIPATPVRYNREDIYFDHD
jgi:hypothetical protein